MGHICAHTPYIGHIWRQPYRESREEGNSREGNPYPIPQRKSGEGGEGDNDINNNNFIKFNKDYSDGNINNNDINKEGES